MNAKLHVLWSYGVLFVLYIFGTLLIPPPKGTLEHYHVSLMHLRVLDLTVIVLYGIIWLCALYGFYTLYEYYKLIEKNNDGKALSKLTVGIGLLAYWLPVTANFSLYTNFLVEKNPSLAAPVGVMQNYLSLILPLLGFIFISMGARRLSELTKQRITFRDVNILLLVLIFIGVTYTHLLSVTHNRLNSAYHLSVMYMLLTLAIPYIYMWGIGLLSVFEIHHYRLKTPGVVYRRSWRLLAFGLGLLVTVTMIIQFLTTISQRLTRLSLDWLLIAVYILLIVLAIAYVFIAIGVQALKRIEEV